MNIRRLTLFISILCIPIVGYSQATNESFQIEEIVVERNGGSAATRNLLLKSNDGFVWYTTYNGLVQYFGSSQTLHSFEPLDVGNVSGFFDLFEDSRGLIWVGTRKGLYKFDPETGKGEWIQWSFPDTKDTAFITGITETSDGDLLLSTNGPFILEYEMADQKLLSYRVPTEYFDKFQREEIESLYYVNVENVLDDGKVIISQFNKFYLFFEGKISLIKDFSDQRTFSNIQYGFSLVENGVLFDKNTSGTYTFEGNILNYEYVPEINRQLIQWPSKSFKWALKDSNAIIAGVHPDSSEKLIFCYLSEDKSELIIDDRKAQFDDKIDDFIGVEGASFMVSTVGGVYKMRFVISSFQTYLVDAEAYNGSKISVRGFAENSKGEVFVGTYNGLFRLDPNGQTTHYPKKHNYYTDTDFEIYRSMVFENDSTILNAGENSAINRIKVYTDDYEDILINDTLIDDNNQTRIAAQTLYKWRENQYLIGTTNGLYSINKLADELIDFSELGNGVSLKGVVIKDILVDENMMYIASTRNGLFRKNLLTNEVENFSIKDANSPSTNKEIFVLHKALNGDLLLGTTKGVYSFTPETSELQVFGTYGGLSKSIVTGILEEENSIWFSTYNGLIGYNKRDNWFYHFFEKDGLPHNEFNQESFFKASNGLFYFGGLNGVTSFNPTSIKFKKSDATLKITEATFYNKKEDTIRTIKSDFKKQLSAIELPYSKNVLSLKFAMSELFLPEEHSYEYKLEGFNSQWVSLGNDTTLRLNAIPPGEYNLKIRGDDASKNPAKNEIIIPVKVDQIFYKKPWFVTLNVLFITGFFIGFYHFRKYRWKEKYRNQRKVDQLEAKALRAQMNPHFMFNALNGLQSTMILKGEREANKYLGSFSKLLRSSLDMSNSDTISLAEEIDYLNAYLNLEKLRQARELTGEIKVIPEDLEIEDIQIPCMLFQPIIENAIMHGLSPKRDGDATIDVLFTEEHGQLVGSVIDNGIGREAAAKLKEKNRKNHKSWATHIMKERIEIINKYTDQNIDFYIEDLYHNGAPSGTKVVLRMPLLYKGV